MCCMDVTCVLIDPPAGPASHTPRAVSQPAWLFASPGSRRGTMSKLDDIHRKTVITDIKKAMENRNYDFKF
jgi:hypothetical protein